MVLIIFQGRLTLSKYIGIIQSDQLVPMVVYGIQVHVGVMEKSNISRSSVAPCVPVQSLQKTSVGDLDVSFVWFPFSSITIFNHVPFLYSGRYCKYWWQFKEVYLRFVVIIYTSTCLTNSVITVPNTKVIVCACQSGLTCDQPEARF